MTLDTTIHWAELLVILGAAWTVFRGGIGLRDAVRDMTGAVKRLDDKVEDHESRLRYIEVGDRRMGHDRRSFT